MPPTTLLYSLLSLASLTLKMKEAVGRRKEEVPQSDLTLAPPEVTQCLQLLLGQRVPEC